MLAIAQVESDAEIDAAREILLEYTSWALTLSSESSQAPTFQGLDEELRTVPGVYSPPTGRPLLATQDGQPAGCVCLKGHNSTTCELKRLYVRPSFRTLGIGQRLVSALVEEARQSGYQRIVLDSHVSMKRAHSIYQETGFRFGAAPADFQRR